MAGTRTIPLANSPLTVIIDADLCERLLAMTWRAQRSREGSDAYASTTIERRVFRMHRLIVGAAPSQIVDHINGNTLDNRRVNLRFVTMQQSNWNTGPRRGHRYKGVSWDRSRNRWAAYITVDGRRRNLGRYLSAEEAAHVYDAAARLFHGEYARPNFAESRAA